MEAPLRNMRVFGGLGASLATSALLLILTSPLHSPPGTVHSAQPCEAPFRSFRPFEKPYDGAERAIATLIACERNLSHAASLTAAAATSQAAAEADAAAAKQRIS